MLDIKIVPESTQENFDKGLRPKKSVQINGIIDPRSIVRSASKNDMQITLRSDDVIKQFTQYRFAEIPDHISEVTLDSGEEYAGGMMMKVTILSNKVIDHKAELEISMLPRNRDTWKRRYSLIELFDKSKELFKHYGLEEEYELFNHPQLINNANFRILKKIDDLQSKIDSQIEVILVKLQQIILEAIELVNPEHSDNIVLESFDFPVEIKTACKQYLIYFAQFLSDIGIDADTEIKEEANKTLFKVIPRDRGESLDRVKEALNIYLSVPTNPNFEKEASSQLDVSTMQLAANVMHLKSQVMMAQSTIQMKDATIEALQLSNYTYRQMLDDVDKKQAGEDVIPGIVKIKRYEGKGFSVDLAELFRRMKRKLGK
ncbi:MAG: hypothetical protein EOO06_20245 [Chitinophagaceae bacterium]|nr:MAG: hypothetical protein EOO06_20245 [Chitinophagaceae bacterium]